MISNSHVEELPPECDPFTDICSRTTVIIMAVLALINVAVIFQGVLSCKKKLDNANEEKKCEIKLLYALAFLSLGTAVLYCFSWSFIKKQASCGDYIVESLPAFLYLLSAYAYMTWSIAALKLKRI